jgi:uncharacterized RDD family membrane protein YckC
MTCPYCKATNEDDDHRCHRCGRRLGAGGATSDPHPPIRSAVAPALNTEYTSAAAPAAAPKLRVVPRPAAPAAAPDPGAPAIQPSLFGPQEVPRTPAPSARREAPRPTPRPKRDRLEQPKLDFMADGGHALKPSVEAAIYCNAPVAPPSFRATAAIIDTALGLLGTAAFLATFHYSGQPLEFTKQTLPVYGAAALLISVLYRVLFCLGNGDTAGLRFTKLCVVNFDGHRPTRRQRFYRLGGGAVGVVAAGMGLLWAIFDEERLTWHDHISKTFPTVADTQG